MSHQRSYPYTITNGAGEWLTFARRIPGPDGDRVEGELRASPGAGPPMHVHFLQDEGFTVVSGRLGFQRPGSAPEFAEAGASVVFPAGVPHRFWNPGTEELRCRAYIAPAGNAEFFLEQLFASQAANGGRRPSLLDIAYLTRRYRSEYAMVEIPALVQRLVFPVLVLIGKLTGRHAKFADAPEPLGR